MKKSFLEIIRINKGLTPKDLKNLLGWDRTLINWLRKPGQGLRMQRLSHLKRKLGLTPPEIGKAINEYIDCNGDNNRRSNK